MEYGGFETVCITANLAVATGKIADLAVSSAKIANAAITNAKIGNLAVSTAQIADAAITDAKIANLSAAKITTGTLSADRIAAGSITSAKLTVANGFITNAMIADATIQSAKIAVIDAGKITTGTLTAARIGAGSITADKMTTNFLEALTGNSSIRITGTTISYYSGSTLTSQINSSGFELNRDGTKIGRIGTNNISGQSSWRGLVFDLEYAGNYMTWAWRETSGATSYTTKLTYYRSKLADGMEKGFHFDDVVFLMSNWLIKATFDWLEPIYDALKEMLCMHKVLHSDETSLQVLREPDKPPESKSNMWLYRTSGDTENPIVLYEYQPDKKAERPKRFLKKFSGYLHADGYDGYHDLSDTIKVVGCFAHARRKFDEAIKGMPKKDQTGSLAMIGKKFCDKLFSLERDFASLTADERLQKRQELSKPVFNEFYRWLATLNPPPKTGLAAAVVYMRNQREYLERYLEDGRLEISNNRAERSIKPFVIGRKNWLFVNTPRGAKASAILYSIIETAKENGLNPYEYLTYIFKNAPNWDIRNNPDYLDLLMPYNAKKHCNS